MSPRKSRYCKNLKVVKRKGGSKHFYYRLPNGKFETLGKDIPVEAAIDAATALNIALSDQESLINRISKRAEELRNYNPQNPPMSQVIDEFKVTNLDAALEQGKQSKETIESKKYKLDEYMANWGKIRVQEIRTFDLANLVKTKTPHAQAKHVPLLRELFRYAVTTGYRDDNPANELKAATPEPRQRERHTLSGYMKVREAAPDWLKRAMDIAMYSLQRRGDLVEIQFLKDINLQERTIRILQRKTQRYKHPVFIDIAMGDILWNSVQDAISSKTHCPYLIHCRPLRMDKRDMAAKPHPFYVMPDYLTKQFRKWRDKSGAYDHLAPKERPMFHDIRALGIMLYHKAGYPKEYIMALAGHAKESTTDHYIEGHEKPKPLRVAAELDISSIAIEDIDWRQNKLPPELAKLIDEEG